MESAHEKGNPENNKLKQEGVRLRNGIGTPGDRMFRTISVIALRKHPGQPLSPRETRTVGTQMMCHTMQHKRVSVSWTKSSLGTAVSYGFSKTVNQLVIKEIAGFRPKPSAGYSISL